MSAAVAIEILRGRLGWTVEASPRLEAAIATLASGDGEDADAWLARARHDERRMGRLVDAAVVPHTAFGRHPEQLELLEERLRGRPGPVRIWSAGCATGEEVWDLALRAARAGTAVEVLGTDVSPAAIRFAKEGKYPARRAAGLAVAGPGGWNAPDSLRRSVRFAVRAVQAGADGAPFDFVFCRNLLLYFDRADATQALAGIAARLAPGGAIVVAPAEALLPLPPMLSHGEGAGWIVQRTVPAKRAPVPPRPAGPLERAARLLGSGEVDGAEQALRALLDERPDHAHAWFLLGETLLERREPAQARAAFRKAASCGSGRLAAAAKRRAGMTTERVP